MNEKPYSELWVRLREATPTLKESERSPYLERICGVKQPSVSRWRRGEAGLNPNHAKAISLDTGFCRQYLTDGNGPKRWDLSGGDFDELAALLDKMDEERRAETIRFARFQAQD